MFTLGSPGHGVRGPTLARLAEKRDADGKEVAEGDVLRCISHGRNCLGNLGHFRMVPIMALEANRP